MTGTERRNAVAADAEYRRRHPDEKLRPLRWAGPGPVSDAERDEVARGDTVAAWVGGLAEANQAFEAEMESRRGVLVPSEDPDCEPEGEAFPDRPERDTAPLYVPPVPDMPASPRIAEPQPELEA